MYKLKAIKDVSVLFFSQIKETVAKEISEYLTHLVTEVTA